MKRTIALTIDAKAKTCGNCECAQIVGSFRRCRVFDTGIWNGRGDTEARGTPRRLAECIKAEQAAIAKARGGA